MDAVLRGEVEGKSIEAWPEIFSEPWPDETWSLLTDADIRQLIADAHVELQIRRLRHERKLIDSGLDV